MRQFIAGLRYKWQQRRKVYTQSDLTKKLAEYRTWLMDRTKYDFEDMRNRLLAQESIINELKNRKGITQKPKRIQRKRSSRASKRV